MISAKGFETYLESVYRATAVYMWGADCEIGTKELLEKKIKQFGKENYEDLTVEKIEGKICADCSGLFTPISCLNITSQSYYGRCVEKGRIGQIPTNKKCLLFREEKGKIVHVAGYLGNGYLIEMWDGCEKRKFKESEWTYYGLPDWLEEQEDELVVGGTVKITDSIDVFNTALDAKLGKNILPYTYQAGTYYIYKINKLTGAVNITKTKGTPGAWVILP